MKRPPVELVERLRLARERGETFWDAWPTAVLLATHDRRDGVAWRDVFSETRVTWERAYAGLPATEAESAAAVLAASALGDVQEVHDRPCDVCGADLDALGRSAEARYCGEDCQRAAAVVRQREARAAYSRRRRAQVKATVAGGVGA